jgi:hypothetical protein
MIRGGHCVFAIEGVLPLATPSSEIGDYRFIVMVLLRCAPDIFDP